MPYYLVDITELPYPHGMGTRGEHSNCPFAISTLRRELRKPNSWSPGPAGYRELFTDEALLLRARNCDVHQGDWAVALPVVVGSGRHPTATDTLTIARAAPATHGQPHRRRSAWRWPC